MGKAGAPFCIACKGDLPTNHVQQGGMHIGCANKEITVYTIRQHGTRYCVDFNELEVVLDAMGFDNEEMTIRKRQMTRIEFESLPEFTGF